MNNSIVQTGGTILNTDENSKDVTDEQREAAAKLLQIAKVVNIKLDKYGYPNETAPYIEIPGVSKREDMIEGICQYIKEVHKDNLECFRELELRDFLRCRHWAIIQKGKPFGHAKTI